VYILLGHTSLEPGSRGGGPVKGEDAEERMVAGFMESAVAVDIDRIGIAVIGVIEREGIAEVNVDPIGMGEGDTGERDGDESLIEIGVLKEKPVGDIKGKRRGEKRGHWHGAGGEPEEGSRLTFLRFDIGTKRSNY
jgi:hypothetical protein